MIYLAEEKSINKLFKCLGGLLVGLWLHFELPHN